MDFTDKQIEPPKTWQKFEDICHDLFKRVWVDPFAKKNGRTGQAQHGVDIYGSQQSQGHSFRGVQCKGKDRAYGEPPTIKEFREELAKAEKFEPLLQYWTFATTAPPDAKLERDVRILSETRVRAGSFPVDILFWEDIQSLIADYPDVLEKHYKEHVLDVRGLRDAVAAVPAQATLVEFNSNIDAVLAAIDRSSATQTSDIGASPNPEETDLNARIDEARDWLLRGRPSVAIEALREIEKRTAETASQRTRFRITTNIASGLLNLGNFEEAANLFVTAFALAPDDPKAQTNLALAHLLRDDPEQARDVAKGVIATDPNNNEALAVLIRTGGEAEVRDALSHPEISASTYHAAAQWYRENGQISRSTEILRDAHAAFPDDRNVAADLATSILEAFSGDEKALYGRNLSAEQQTSIGEATSLLKSYLDETAGCEVTQPVSAYAVNYSSALRAAGRAEDATEFLEGFARRSGDDPIVNAELVRLRLVSGDAEGAIRASEQISNPPSDVLRMRAEALASLDRFQEAYKTVELAISASEDALSLRSELPKFMWLAQLEEEAIRYANDLVSEFPDRPEPLVGLADVLRRKGDLQGSADKAREALKLTNENDALQKLIIAEALYDAEEFGQAADLFAEFAGRMEDNHALRRLVASLANADRRRQLFDLLASLPTEVQQQPFYLRVHGYVAERSGDLADARSYFDAYLEHEPDDHMARLVWLQILGRLRDETTLNAFLDDHGELAGAPFEYQFAYAHILDTNGRGEAALALGYRLRRDHYEEAKAHLGYAGLIIMGESVPDAIPRPTEIAENVAFTVGAPSERSRSFVIEPDYEPNPSRGEIGPASDLAKRAFGKSQGDKVKIVDTPATDEVEIIEVKHKYFHAFHDTMANFNSMFPSEKGLIGFSFGKPEEAFEKMRAVSEPRTSYLNNLAEMYRSHPIPIGIMARLAGVDPIIAWYGLLELNEPVRVCAGNQSERDSAVQRLADAKCLVVDPVTFWIAGTLNVIDEIEASFGKLRVTQSTIEVLRRHSDDLKADADRETMRVAVIDGELTRFVATAEQNRKAYEFATKMLARASTQSIIVPAVPRDDLSKELQQVFAEMDPAFLDTIMAANGEGGLLLSEDHHLRGLANMASVPGAWLQAALIGSKNIGCLSPEKYVEVTRYLAEAQHDYTSVNADVLINSLQAAGWQVGPGYRRIVSRALGPNAELRSVVRIAAEFVTKLWSKPTPRSVACPALQAFLDALLPSHREKARHLAEVIAEGAKNRVQGEFAGRLRVRQAINACVAHWKGENYQEETPGH